MRLNKIEIAGFRGFRERTNIPFGAGFTIITGRNGSGKSSICDAIEFVLTERLSRFSEADVEGGERISDYVWWRGSSDSAIRRVAATFTRDSRQFYERVITPKGVQPGFDVCLLYNAKSHPPDPLLRLCQTAII